MGYCEYHNDKKSGPWNGYYCDIVGGTVEHSLYTHYCTDSIRCVYCPLRGGDDRDRKPAAPEPEPEPAREKPSYRRYEYEEPEKREDSRDDNRGGGGGGGGPSFFDAVGAGIRIFGLSLIIAVIIWLIYMICYFFGILGPWVQFQLPADSPLAKDASLYAVSWDSDSRFKSRSGKFDKEGLAEPRLLAGTSSVYYSRDEASVWFGTTNLLVGNTAVVYDVTEEDIQSQLFQTILIHLTDTQGEPIPAAPVVTLEDGKTVEVLHMGGDLWMVKLPDDLREPSLNLEVEGYEPFRFSLKMKERVMEAQVQLAAKEA